MYLNLYIYLKITELSAHNLYFSIFSPRDIDLLHSNIFVYFYSLFFYLYILSIGTYRIKSNESKLCKEVINYIMTPESIHDCIVFVSFLYLLLYYTLYIEYFVLL